MGDRHQPRRRTARSGIRAPRALAQEDRLHAVEYRADPPAWHGPGACDAPARGAPDLGPQQRGGRRGADTQRRAGAPARGRGDPSGVAIPRHLPRPDEASRQGGSAGCKRDRRGELHRRARRGGRAGTQAVRHGRQGRQDAGCSTHLQQLRGRLRHWPSRRYRAQRQFRIVRGTHGGVSGQDRSRLHRRLRMGPRGAGCLPHAPAAHRCRHAEPLHERGGCSHAGPLLRISRRHDHGRARHDRQCARNLSGRRARRLPATRGDGAGSAGPRATRQVLEPQMDRSAARRGIFRRRGNGSDNDQPVRLAGHQASGGRQRGLAEGPRDLRGRLAGLGTAAVV